MGLIIDSKKINDMNKVIKYLLLMLFVTSIVSCHKDDYVDIDTLSKYGDTYYGGQEIPVWVGVTTHDEANTEYKWECSGGTFSSYTDKVRTVWVAPYQKGEYEVKCTVTCGGASQTRRTVMNVEKFYFEEFGLEPSSDLFTKSSSSMSYTWTNNEILLSSSYNTYAYIWTSFADTDFRQPFQTSVDMAWRDTWSYPDYPFGIRLTFARPESNPEIYYRYIEMKFYPQREKSMTTTNVNLMAANNVEAARLQRIIDDNYMVEFESYNSDLSDEEIEEIVEQYKAAQEALTALESEETILNAEKDVLDPTEDAARIAEIEDRLEEIASEKTPYESEIDAVESELSDATVDSSIALLDRIVALEADIEALAEDNIDIVESASSYTSNLTITAQQYNVAYGTTTSTTLLSTYDEKFYLTDGSFASDNLGMNTFSISVDADNYVIVSITPYGEDEAHEVVRTQVSFDQNLCLEDYAFGYHPSSNIYIDNIYIDYQL